jgi:formate dehydrogenase maturation protein FdhE
MNEKPTAKNDNRYCPMCESDSITGDCVEVDHNSARQDVYCNDCHASWTDVYEFRKKECINPGEE